MSKFNKSRHIDKNLFYENEYYQDLDESYKIILLSTHLDKLQYKNQLVTIFLKCFPLLRNYKSYGFLCNPKQDIESMLLSNSNKICILIEENSNEIISFFTTTNENSKIIISNACTRPSKNRMGFMRLLLGHYLKKVSNVVELDVFEENPAVHLYKSLGFKFVQYIDKNEISDFWEDGMYSKKCIYRFNKH